MVLPWEEGTQISYLSYKTSQVPAEEQKEEFFEGFYPWVEQNWLLIVGAGVVGIGGLWVIRHYMKKGVI